MLVEAAAALVVAAAAFAAFLMLSIPCSVRLRFAPPVLPVLLVLSVRPRLGTRARPGRRPEAPLLLGALLPVLLLRMRIGTLSMQAGALILAGLLWLGAPHPTLWAPHPARPSDRPAALLPPVCLRGLPLPAQVALLPALPATQLTAALPPALLPTTTPALPLALLPATAPALRASVTFAAFSRKREIAIRPPSSPGFSTMVVHFLSLRLYQFLSPFGSSKHTR